MEMEKIDLYQNISLQTKDIKASKIIITPDEEKGFIPLPLRQLVPDKTVNFDVFLKYLAKKNSIPQFAICCPHGRIFERSWHLKLTQLGIPWVYFYQDDEASVLQYMNLNLENLLVNEKIDLNKKAELVCDVTLLWIRHFFNQERARVGVRLDLALGYLDRIYQNIKSGDINRSFIADIWRQDQTLYAHSLNTCLFGLAFTNYLGWTEEEARVFGLGSLLHDIGMAQLPKGILRKPNILQKEEWALIKKHPIKGFHLLKNFTDLPREVLLMVLEHHENGDGSGYPNGLKISDTHPWSRILRIVDSYEAITASRCWRPARSPKEALWSIRHGCENSKIYDPYYLTSFIKFLGGI